MIKTGIYRELDQKDLTKIIQQWDCLIWSWVLMHFDNGSHSKYSARLRAFCRSSSIWKGMGMLQFRKSCTHQGTKTLQKDYPVFRDKLKTLHGS